LPARLSDSTTEGRQANCFESLLDPIAQISRRHCRLQTPLQDAPTETIQNRDQVTPASILNQQIAGIGLPLPVGRDGLYPACSCKKHFLTDFLTRIIHEDS